MFHLIIYCGISWAKPFDQARDAAQQEEEEKRADSNWKNLSLWECKKSFASSTKNEFYDIVKWVQMKAF